MVEDTSGHDAFAEALAGSGEGQATGTLDAGSVADQQAPETGQEAAQGGSQVQAGAEQPATQQAPAFDINALPEDIRKKLQGYDERETWAPPHRLREEAEARRQLEGRLAGFEERERQRQAEEQRRKEEEALRTEDFYQAEPQQFIDRRVQHGFQQAVSPLQQQINQMFQQQQAAVLHNARLVAGSVLGDDKVKAAEEAFNRAAQTGAIDPAEHQRINSAPNPYEAAVRWHQKQSTLEAIGGDLDGYNQRQQEALLKDPAFLARALEAHRSQATPVQTGVPGRASPSSQPRGAMPSLNRQTSAADDGAEEDDPRAVFDQALNAPRTRMTG